MSSSGAVNPCARAGSPGEAPARGQGAAAAGKLVLKPSVGRRFLLLLGTADSEGDFAVWQGLGWEGTGCFSKVLECTWQSVPLWGCAVSRKCLGSTCCTVLPLRAGCRAGGQQLRCWQEGSWRWSLFLFPPWSAGRSVHSSLLWRALPFGARLMRPVSFCRSHVREDGAEGRKIGSPGDS